MVQFVRARDKRLLHRREIVKGGFLGHVSDLERDLRKNSGSVKTSVTMAFWLQIGESGGRVGGSWELCWLMLALC